eukprot:COSAG01_NODE_1248_length_11071_cov_30.622676_4_plen_149_part_00
MQRQLPMDVSSTSPASHVVQEFLRRAGCSICACGSGYVGGSATATTTMLVGGSLHWHHTGACPHAMQKEREAEFERVVRWDDAFAAKLLVSPTDAGLEQLWPLLWPPRASGTPDGPIAVRRRRGEPSCVAGALATSAVAMGRCSRACT